MINTTLTLTISRGLNIERTQNCLQKDYKHNVASVHRMYFINDMQFFNVFIRIKTYISNFVHTTRFWNNLHAPSISKEWKVK